MMKKMLDVMEENPDLKKALLKKLKECQESWIKSRNKQTTLGNSLPMMANQSDNQMEF